MTTASSSLLTTTDSSSISSSSHAGPSNTSSSSRATKRKLEDAIQSLDDAVGSPEKNDQPSPAKRPHIARSTRSLYSTLAKYGIKTKDTKSRALLQSRTASIKSGSNLLKNAPHLSAILARAASHTRKANPFKPADIHPTLATNHQHDPTKEYRPSSLPSFLTRLATYKLVTYANKPPAIDAVAASKCGWINDGKDRLACGICGVSWVIAGREGMTRDAANALVEKQRISLVEMHKNGCPWKTRQCDSSIYHIPLQSASVMVRELKTNAYALEKVLKGVQVKHPLTATQVQSLRSAITFAAVTGSGNSNDEPPVSVQEEPSESALLTALFGWTVEPAVNERPRRTTLSRSKSLSISASPSRPMSRSPSPSSVCGETPPFISRPRPLASALGTARDPSLLHCALCQRRVGLWAFVVKDIDLTQGSNEATAENDITAPSKAPTYALSQRQFDLLKEHRSYCPYVVRSTVIPSLPVPQFSSTPNGPGRATAVSRSTSNLSHQSNEVEGWRAVLTVSLRFGMGERQRLAWPRSDNRESAQDTTSPVSMELDGVEAMVAGVKARGGRELLKYVKGLLG